MSRRSRTEVDEPVNGPELAESSGNPTQSWRRYKGVRTVLRSVVTRPNAVALVLALIAALTVASFGAPALADAGVGQATAPSDTPPSIVLSSQADTRSSTDNRTPTETPSPTADEPTSTDRTSSGEHLAGTLSAHEESVGRNLSRRTLETRLLEAPDDTARARALAGECDRLGDRMQSLQDRADRLERAHENGSLTHGEFRVKMTGLEAESRTIADLAEECTERGQRLPDDVVDDSDINASDYREVGRQVGTFSREELAEHAFDVTGNASSLAVVTHETVTDESLQTASSDQIEAIAEAEGELAVLERQRDDAAASVDDSDDDAREALDCATEAIEAARNDLERARTAASEGDDDTFEDRMADARDHMDSVETCIERAYEEAGS